MVNTVAREPRTVIRGTLYRGHEGMWSWVLHRITGVGMYFFLLVHILDTATVRLDPELYNVVMEAYKTPIMGLGEAGLVAAIVFHAFNGLRIILVDMTRWAVRHQRALFYGVLVLWTVVMVAFLPRHLMHVFGG
ncbi:MAG: succinate dehydrogenase, cytochrome b556 subunit [Microbacteriaceae bacterium]|nr:succinate dehydrogenase, cytochrome b556 subunit [Microbacteriaceae bacterium]